MIVGFSGTSEGITAKQAYALRKLLEYLSPREFHHGDCVGADEQAHQIARTMGTTIVIHPPEVWKHRAFCTEYNRISTCKPYLVRNKDIALECDVLVATPKTREEQLRSGTWATVRYARKLGRRVYLVHTDGSTTELGE